jgi:plasmid stabilization system protein ParE
VRALKVRYTIDALLHLGAIHSYIHERNPVAATRVIARVRAAAEQLGEHPEDEIVILGIITARS